VSKHHVEAEVVIRHIRERRKDLPKEGVRKLHFALGPLLCNEGISIGRDRLFSLLRGLGMLQKRKRRRVPQQAGSSEWMSHPNLIADVEPPSKHGSVWGSDMTYLRFSGKFAFLSLVTDHYNREIVGHELSTNLATSGPMAALAMAIENSHPKAGLIHHSDRGCQYASHSYTRCLEMHGIRISMTRGGEPTANAIAERVNGILKHELGLGKEFASYAELDNAVKRAISIYNNKRPHASLNYLTPVQARSKSGTIKKQWYGKKTTELLV
jgi:putative transposase